MPRKHFPPYKKQGLVKAEAIPEDVSHQRISSYFIGAQAENLSYFEENIHIILEQLKKARTSYFHEDGVSYPCTVFSDLVRTNNLTKWPRNSLPAMFRTRRGSRYRWRSSGGP